MTPLERIVRHCDATLNPHAFQDWDGACNGLQVENDGSVTRIAAAVDGSLATIRMAVEARADLLLVHHGLFWNRTHPWTGKRREMLRLLIQHNLAVYSSHLPLDAHPKLGNNAGLCAALGFKKTKSFFDHKGTPIGLKAVSKIGRDELSRRLAEVLGAAPVLLPGGGGICRSIGVVTGGAGAELKQAAEEGVDTFITGEGPHWTHALAEDAGINVFYGGHYATETFGVKALAAHLSRKFKLPWVFLDHPSGL